MDGTGFNVQHWGRYSLEAFIDECKTDKTFSKYSEEDRVKLLTIVHGLIVKQYELNTT